MFYFLSIKFKENEGNLGSTKTNDKLVKGIPKSPSGTVIHTSVDKDGRKVQAVLMNALNLTFWT